MGSSQMIKILSQFSLTRYRISLLSQAENNAPWRKGIEIGIFPAYYKGPNIDDSFLNTVREPRGAYKGSPGIGKSKTWCVQFSSVTQSCLTLCDPMDCSTPGIPVHHQPLELTQIHVHQVGDATQLSHSLSSPSPPVFNISQHQDLFKGVSSSYQVAKVLEFQLQYQSFQ